MIEPHIKFVQNNVFLLILLAYPNAKLNRRTIIRICSIMASGQRLSVKVKQSRRALEDTMMKKDMSYIVYKGDSDKVHILRKRLEVYQYLFPIAPYAVFALSNKTFCTTLASVITYIVVLIKLRGVETSKAIPEAILANNTAQF